MVSVVVHKNNNNGSFNPGMTNPVMSFHNALPRGDSCQTMGAIKRTREEIRPINNPLDSKLVVNKPMPMTPQPEAPPLLVAIEHLSHQIMAFNRQYPTLSRCLWLSGLLISGCLAGAMFSSEKLSRANLGLCLLATVPTLSISLWVLLNNHIHFYTSRFIITTVMGILMIGASGVGAFLAGYRQPLSLIGQVALSVVPPSVGALWPAGQNTVYTQAMRTVLLSLSLMLLCTGASVASLQGFDPKTVLGLVLLGCVPTLFMALYDLGYKDPKKFQNEKNILFKNTSLFLSAVTASLVGAAAGCWCVGLTSENNFVSTMLIAIMPVLVQSIWPVQSLKSINEEDCREESSEKASRQESIQSFEDLQGVDKESTPTIASSCRSLQRAYSV